VGLWDSFTSGLSSFWGTPTSPGFGDALGQLGSQMLGTLAVRGAGELGDMIFGRQTTAGSPQSGAMAQMARRVGSNRGTGYSLGMNPNAYPGGNYQTGIQVGQGGNMYGLPSNLYGEGHQIQTHTASDFYPTNAYGQRYNEVVRPLPASQPMAGITPFSDLGYPSGAPMAFPTTRSTGFQTAAFDIPGFDIRSPLAAQGMGGVGGLGSMTMFRPTMAGASAQTFMTANPVTGRTTWFRPAGRPILWSGDIACAKRVQKVARRAKKR